MPRKKLIRFHDGDNPDIYLCYVLGDIAVSLRMMAAVKTKTTGSPVESQMDIDADALDTVPDFGYTPPVELEPTEVITQEATNEE